jgi:predicted short-subunit dehydrogenase-like oxidoreductase (DUF2520 family)
MRPGVVGRGAVGGFLARALGFESGDTRWLGRDEAPPTGINLLFLCVPDRAVATAVASLRGSGCRLVHCSGALGLEGADAVWHPMRAFPKGAPPPADLGGCVVGLRGDDAIAQWLAERTEVWGGEPVHLAAAAAADVHLACCFAAGYSALMADIARQYFTAAGLSFEQVTRALQGLAGPAVAAVLERGASAITGPAQRGDWAVLAKHHARLETADRALHRALLEALDARGVLPQGLDAVFGAVSADTTGL